MQAAAAAGVSELIDPLPRGWETPLHPSMRGGVDLSGGQWQGLALARGLHAIEQGASLLILDEPTANLDPRAELHFFDAVLGQDLGRAGPVTTILISHRFATVRHADRIVVLEAGRVSQDGTHRELMDRAGAYRSLFESQARAFAAVDNAARGGGNGCYRSTIVTVATEIPAFVPGHRRTPVIAGIGQVANKDDDRVVHPMDLIESAARLALADAGIEPARVGGVLATPLSVYSTDDPSLLLASRLDLPAGLRRVTGYSGAAPQKLIAQACQAIADGQADAVLIVGGIADASVRRARRAGIEPPAPPTSRWSQGSTPPTAGLRDVRRLSYADVPEMAAGAGLPSAYFALVESALEAGKAPNVHREALGRLLAPFTETAARRPELAWFPTARRSAELSTPTPQNRLVAEPYTKLMCSFPTVDLAAALVIAAAPEDSPAVRPLTIVSASEAAPPSGRPVFHRSTALEQAVELAQTAGGISLRDIAQFDLYSCFPAAVKVASNALGLGVDDPRPRTASGGLPYFGGPGASYSIHGIACLVEDLRSRPETIGAAVSLGGMMTDFAFGVYATAGRPCALHDLGTHTVNAVETVDVAEGPALVEAATVLHDSDRGPVAAPIIARLPGGTRVGARAGDPGLPAALAGGPSLVGREVLLSTGDDGRVRYEPR